MSTTFLGSFNVSPRNLLRTGPAALASAVVFALAIIATPIAQAQTFTVIHTFTDGGDGAQPYAGLTMDAAGNLYGTANGGGAQGVCSSYGCGTVFKLTKRGASWVLTPLYSFAGGDDGEHPQSRVTIVRDGTLYGTTFDGGSSGGGTVFHLRPSAAAPKSALAPWNHTVLYNFDAFNSGFEPQGDLTFDPSGNIYGTAEDGGINVGGTIYELTPLGGTWTQTVLYSPSYQAFPRGGVIFDGSGNLDGVLSDGGQHGLGAVYQLSPSGSNWTEQTIYNFFEAVDGIVPFGGLIIDPSGNLYGTTFTGGSDEGGTVFELTSANGGWTLNTLYNLTGSPGCGPQDKLVMDAAGNLYGTTYCDGAYELGSVFKLTPSNGAWTYTSLHDFTGGSDGKHPLCSLVFDANGNLYGTTTGGGSSACVTDGCGVAFEITP
jgi:uncharacterized repeat protein (TIGR03803 family)